MIHTPYATSIRKRPRPKAHKFYPILSRSHEDCEHCDLCNECMVELSEQAENERPGHVWTVVEGKVVFMEDAIAQSILGRPLNEKEAAIHKDQNPLNNTRANIEIVTIPDLSA